MKEQKEELAESNGQIRSLEAQVKDIKQSNSEFEESSRAQDTENKELISEMISRHQESISSYIQENQDKEQIIQQYSKQIGDLENNKDLLMQFADAKRADSVEHDKIVKQMILYKDSVKAKIDEMK